MTTGAADVADLIEVGLRPFAQPVDECGERPRVGCILSLELTQLRLRTFQDELGEGRGIGAKACP